MTTRRKEDARATAAPMMLDETAVQRARKRAWKTVR
jgi:hypothetical protein